MSKDAHCACGLSFDECRAKGLKIYDHLVREINLYNRPHEEPVAAESLDEFSEEDDIMPPLLKVCQVCEDSTPHVFRSLIAAIQRPDSTTADVMDSVLSARRLASNLRRCPYCCAHQLHDDGCDPCRMLKRAVCVASTALSQRTLVVEPIMAQVFRAMQDMRECPTCYPKEEKNK